MLASACPGWVCYAEKTHGSYVLPHISATKSPQVRSRCSTCCPSRSDPHNSAAEPSAKMMFQACTASCNFPCRGKLCYGRFM